MAQRHLVVWNASTGTLQVLQTGDTGLIEKNLDLVGDFTASGTVNGRNMATDGAKVDNLTVTAPVNLDTVASDVASAKGKTDNLTVSGAVDLDTINTKVAYLTVTGAVDLDAINTAVAAVTNAVVLKGNWDASTGNFPTSTAAGESWVCTIGGSIGGTAYYAGDRIIALVDGASTTLPSHWYQERYTDSVTDVNGKVGSVSLEEADITDLQSYLLAADLDTISKINALCGKTIITQDAIDTFAKLNAIVADANFVASDGSVPVDYIDFTPAAAPVHTEGRTFYDSVRKTLSYYTDEAEVTMNVGEENWIHVRNDTGSTILNGTPVYISGASGGIPQITKIQANSERCIGIATHDIETATLGRVTTHGTVAGVNLSSFSVGDTLWVSPTTPGVLQNTQPDWPDTSIEVGIVLDNGVSGILLVDIEHHGNADVLNKSYNFSARTAASGTYYLAGFYEAPTADANLTQAAPTVVLGTADAPYAAHAFMVFGAGSTDGVNITVTVSGTSITDAGVRTPADSEVLYTGPVAGLTLNDMKESVKKWIGQVTYTLTSDGTTFTCDFNYGFCKYEDFHNFDFTLRAFEFVGLADAADAGFDIEVLHHKDTGWTYAATGFVPGNTPLHDLVTEHGTESDVKAGEHFAWKESAVNTSVNGSALEGLIIRVTTSVNNSIAYLNGHITVTT